MPRRSLKSILSKEDLQRLYHEEGKTMKLIGDIYGFGSSAVSNLLSTYNLPKRTSHDYIDKIKDVLTKEKMFELYVKQELTSYQIAEMYNTSSSYVSKLRKEYGINSLRIPFRQKLSKVELIKLYIEQLLSAKEIASLYNVTSSTVLFLINEYNIKKGVNQKRF